MLLLCNPLCPPGKCTCIKAFCLIIHNIFFIIPWIYLNVNPLATAPPKFHGLSCFYVFYGLWYYMNCKTIFQHIGWFLFQLKPMANGHPEFKDLWCFLGSFLHLFLYIIQKTIFQHAVPFFFYVSPPIKQPLLHPMVHHQLHTARGIDCYTVWG